MPFILLIAVALALSGCDAKEYGHLDIRICDAYTMEPIEGAVAVLPDHGLSAMAGSNGRALVKGIAIDMCTEPKYECSYRETTVLIYCEGFIPSALLHARVYPGKVRNGPTVYLFQEGSEDGLFAAVMVEAPEQERINDLVRESAPG